MAESANKQEVVELSATQKDHLRLLIEQLKDAEAGIRTAIERATRERDLVQRQATSFVTFCALDRGITLGKDGWIFDQDALRFVQLNAVSRTPPEKVAVPASRNGKVEA